jgi:hypothetical protein
MKFITRDEAALKEDKDIFVKFSKPKIPNE